MFVFSDISEIWPTEATTAYKLCNFFFQGILVLGNINVKLFRDNSYAIQVNWNKTVLIDHTLIKFWKLSSMVRLKKFYYLKKPN